MDFLPLFLRVQDQVVLVVGAGSVAQRKIDWLRRAGARVRVVAITARAEIVAAADRGELELFLREFRDDDVAGTRLVVAATGDRHVNSGIAASATARGIWFNAVDDADASAAIFPAVIDRSPLIVAVSSGGTAPLLATHVRGKIERLLDASVGQLATWAASLRAEVKRRLPEGAAQRRFWRTLFDGPAARAIADGQPERADWIARRALSAAKSDRHGRVLLVGAGPGDPDLLTLRALRALQEADVILYDRLVGPGILDLARRDAERIDVGKRHGAAEVTQQHIHELLVEHARAGRTVVRLKGGDPLLFARASEELAVLRSHGIDFEIVPGISAAFAAASYAGIPLTERGGAPGVRLLTATACAGGATPDWAEAGRGRDTLVFYMGVAQLDEIAAQLIAHGRAADTPAALVENASRPEQRVVLSTLTGIAQASRDHAVKAPALLVVGEVVRRAHEFRWFGAEPVEAPATTATAQAA
jgi:uroporphyrin-III C-methyltransferase/precorrin-2 dehydrogenase/sirohydrochlorin ferrochelatase